MGDNTGDLCTHICRKSVATIVSSGCTVSPTISLICIRCGWYMGVAKEIYLKYEADEHNYVGLCISFLDHKLKLFAC